MTDERFENFRRSLAQTVESSLYDENLKLYLLDLFRRFEIAELTPEHRRAVRKCRLPLCCVAGLFSGSGSRLHEIAGVTVAQSTSCYFSLECCKELNTLVLKQSYISNAVSRWREPESGTTRIKYLSHASAADLIALYKDAFEIPRRW